MRPRVTIVYNEPQVSFYDDAGERAAVEGVLEAVRAVHKALEEREYPVAELSLAPPRELAVKDLEKLDTDVVFNLFEGFSGHPESEPLVPQILTYRKKPFTGCSAEPMRLGLNKPHAKLLLQAAGIPTPDFQLLNPDILHLFCLRFPCIVKPCGEDASHGITEESVVRTLAALKKRIRGVAEMYGDEVLVERFIGGREFNATVLGDGAVLPVSEIVYELGPAHPRLLTYASKWDPESPEYRGTRAVCPADVLPEEQDRLAATALAACRALGCTGYARADMRMDDKGVLHVLEVNPNPDISPDAGAARQAAAAGMSYSDFIETILRLAMKKEQHAYQGPAHDGRGQTRSNAHPQAFA